MSLIPTIKKLKRIGVAHAGKPLEQPLFLPFIEFLGSLNLT
jgi:hypothetical protein